MQDDLIRLLNAQEIDLEIDKLMKYKNDCPREIESLRKEIEDVEKTFEEKKSRLNEIDKLRRNIESEISAERDLLAQKEKRLLATKNNKEYIAVHNEIELARERIDSLETEDLELMTEQDTLVPVKEELAKQLVTIRETNTKKIKETQKSYDSIESDIAILDLKRNKELDKVNNSRSLAVYTRLRKGKSGIAIATVDKTKHTCRGCFKQLPPQKVLEIRRGARLISCENCGRILVWDTRENE